jgi:hypothetical protein
MFVPRIATTLIYSFFIFYGAKLSFDLSFALARETGMPSPSISSAADPYASEIAFVALTSLVCFISDVLAYAMYPTLVEDYRRGGRISLTKAFGNALRQWKTLVAFSATILLFLLFFILFFLFVYVRIIFTGRVILLLPALVFMIAVFIAFSVLIFFIIPVGVIERKGVFHSYRRSIEVGWRHRTPVFKTTVFFMGVALATVLVAAAGGFKGAGAAVAFTVFVVTRLVQVVSYTYLNVINPYMYLRLEED